MISITTSTPDHGEHGREHLAEALLHALGDVVDVVGDPAEEVAAGLAVDVDEGEAVQLRLDVGPQPLHRPLDDARQQVGLGVGQDRRAHVEDQDPEQDLVQLPGSRCRPSCR